MLTVDICEFLFYIWQRGIDGIDGLVFMLEDGAAWYRKYDDLPGHIIPTALGPRRREPDKSGLKKKR